MKTASRNFTQSTFVYRDSSGHTKEGKRYSYESTGKLYDVSCYDVATLFSVNACTSPILPIHRAIVKHFAL